MSCVATDAHLLSPNVQIRSSITLLAVPMSQPSCMRAVQPSSSLQPAQCAGARNASKHCQQLATRTVRIKGWHVCRACQACPLLTPATRLCKHHKASGAHYDTKASSQHTYLPARVCGDSSGCPRPLSGRLAGAAVRSWLPTLPPTRGVSCRCDHHWSAAHINSNWGLVCALPSSYLPVLIANVHLALDALLRSQMCLKAAVAASAAGVLPSSVSSRSDTNSNGFTMRV